MEQRHGRIAARFALLLSVPLAACTSGVDVTNEQARQFAVGRATPAEVESRLGPPTDATMNSDGTQVLTYRSTRRQYDPMTVVPYLNAFATGNRSASHEVVFQFGADGLLSAYHSQDTGMH